MFTVLDDPQTPPERLFNVALSKHGVRIETTFVVIESRVNCLCGPRVSADNNGMFSAPPSESREPLMCD